MQRTTSADPRAAVHEFLERLEAAVVDVDLDSSRLLFADDVVAFGTKMDVVRGLEPLVSSQWSAIWPNIEDFHFDASSLHAAGAGHMAWGVATWTSTGFDEEGRPFARPGRMTVILERREAAWVAVHTHFSLFPGTPPRTYGPRR